MLELLLERIDHEEFILLSEDIKSSLAEHHIWLQRINLAIATRTPIKEHSFIAEDGHRHCHFGLWLAKIMAEEGFDSPIFNQIDQLHVELHMKGSELIYSLHMGHPLDEPLYASFLDTQRLFFNAVLELLEFSVITTHQFDHTTKLMNRRSIHSILAHEKQRMDKTQDTVCAIAMADIDHFKAFNDRYGHDLGDKVLEHVASVFNSAIRRYDSVARFGGEEFLFVLPDMAINDAARTIERVRKKLSTSQLESEFGPLAVTASFGITQLCPHCNTEGSLKRADIALYKAKARGRNLCVSVDASKLLQHPELCSIDPSEEQLQEIIQKYCEVI